MNHDSNMLRFIARKVISCAELIEISHAAVVHLDHYFMFTVSRCSFLSNKLTEDPTDFFNTIVVSSHMYPETPKDPT